MANQMIALQAHTPQMPDIGNMMLKRDAIMAQRQQQHAALAAAQQEMAYKQAQEDRAAALAKPQLAEAESKAANEQIGAALKFMELSIAGLKTARTPEDALKIGDWLKSQFNDPAYHQSVDHTLSSLPRDPSQFEPWRQQTLYQSLKADEQLKQHFNEVTNGGESWMQAMPEYAGAPTRGATEVPGSRVAAPQGITYIKDAQGNVIPMPTKTVGGDGGSPGLVAGSRGGADTVYGSGQYGQPSKPLTQSTLGEVQDFQRNTLIPATRGKVGAGPDKGTGAVGTYQITYGTLKKYAPKVLGPNWQSSPFTAEVQDNLARAIYEDNKNGDLSKIWAGLPSNRPGAYSDVPWEQVRGKIASVESGGGSASGIQFGKPIPGTGPQAEGEASRKKIAGDFQRISGVNLQTGEDPVHALIAGSTSGGAEQLGAAAKAFIPESLGGGATQGMKNIQALKTLKSTLMLALMPGGRLSTGVSDEDRKSIEAQLANIDDPSIPASARLRGWYEVLRIMRSNAGINTQASRAAAPAQAPKSGGIPPDIAKKYGL